MTISSTGFLVCLIPQSPPVGRLPNPFTANVCGKVTSSGFVGSLIFSSEGLTSDTFLGVLLLEDLCTFNLDKCCVKGTLVVFGFSVRIGIVSFSGPGDERCFLDDFPERTEGLFNEPLMSPSQRGLLRTPILAHPLSNYRPSNQPTNGQVKFRRRFHSIIPPPATAPVSMYCA